MSGPWYGKCVCAACGPPWRDEVPKPPADEFAARLMWGSWMALCPRCGDKRCPGAIDHDRACNRT